MPTGPQRTRQTEWAIFASFALAALGGIAFAVFFVLGGQTQFEGASLAVAFGGLAAGLGLWAVRLLPSGGHVEEHEGFSSPEVERSEVVDQLVDVGRPRRRRWLVRLFGLAGGTITVALLFPLRSLLQPQGGALPPKALAETPWRAGGVRLIDRSGRPVRPEDVSAQSIEIVYPEHHPDAGDAPAFLVRLDPARLQDPPPGGQVGGIVAYSLLCTHAGCAVALYLEGTGQVLCPCHQSVFNLLRAARPVAGPASRPLPGLPIFVDADGYLRASGDFTSPPGPGYWSRP
ncbi:Rieske 2Fe-2S domain-containing protein [Amycolatopsis rhizosphaerae]|uniref:Cytochrome bc1 complex Rieske iron-sulfur subunit n=1 Tax=Amycolatopsis rhizosphaerae TaxID=2053003 RepID=A0A558A6L6_9PSEU|nr:Rieske 2Fe-2S domain-containing protein [Amycolatopsis rhizosphaerae]TVT19895.1 Rieske 2Fe-2S domain-containing protein [Amycolatopsis rhizosphaerae]